jgi:hypothetical protein
VASVVVLSVLLDAVDEVEESVLPVLLVFDVVSVMPIDFSASAMASAKPLSSGGGGGGRTLWVLPVVLLLLALLVLLRRLRKLSALAALEELKALMDIRFSA